MFWKNKHVLVTGHTGFKGGWLCFWLQQLGAKVTGLSLAPITEPNLFSVAEIAKNMHSIIDDIGKLDSVKQIIATHQPEIVFHMAAQPLVRYSYMHPVETYATNVMGTVNILEAIREVGCVRATLVITTDKCYENKEWLWGYRENDTLGGHDPYSNSKACAELVVSAYRTSFFNVINKNNFSMGLASTRAGNVVGGGDWAKDRLIPDVIQSYNQNKTVLIRNPVAIRPWQHVLEPLNGYLMLAERLYDDPKEFSEAWNFGPNENDVKSVQWIVESIGKIMGGNHSWNLDRDAQPHEANYLKLDCSKAHSKLQWHPRWNLNQCLRETVNWYQAYKNGKNMRDVMSNQIESYVNCGGSQSVQDLQ